MQLAESQEQFRIADDFLSEMIDKYERLTKQLESKKSEIISKAQQEAVDLIHSSNKIIENTIREIRQSQAEKEKTKELRKKLKEEEERIRNLKFPEQERKVAKKRDKQLVEEAVISNQVVEKGLPDDEIEVGDMVLLLEQDVTGEVLQINDDEVVVGFNSITFKTQLHKVEKMRNTGKGKNANPIKKRRYSGMVDDMNDKLAKFKLQLDVRGKRGEEAVDLVSRYIDDAILLNVNEVRILHGKGFGILRNMIHEYLGTVSEVKQYKDEHVERGGQGITVVILK
ncbi:MAG: Smr/MutS family protein [Bacteroidales bacterium]